VATLVRHARGRRGEEGLLLLGFGALAGAALASAGPALGVVDVRFVPLAQLSLALAGAAGLGLLLARIALADVAALGVVLLSAWHADSRSQVLRHWIDWNYSGLEAKELWPAWRQLMEKLRGGPGDPRVAFEYGPVHERAGSIRMHETVALFSGRSGIEGAYNQSSTTTHPVYYLISELFPSSPNPFRSRTYSRFDAQTALARLRLLAVGRIVAVTETLESSLDTRSDVVREARIPPYTLYRLAGEEPRYVEPMSYAPVRSSPAGWQDQAFHWFSRKPPNRALLVFTDDTRFGVPAADPWAPPPEVSLAGGVEVTEAVEPESIRITTSRPGHPLLVKVSYHPRWRADGAFGPYLVSPGLMLVVPFRHEVRLFYAARTWSDWLGLSLAFAAAAMVVGARRRRRGCFESPGEAPPARGGQALVALPLVLVVGLAALRLVPEPSRAAEVEGLYERASRAYAAERWEDAAEFARAAIALLPSREPRRDELLCVRGEALLRAGHPREAVEPLTRVAEGGRGPYRPQALYSGAVALEASGDARRAAVLRRTLREEYPETPWARRLGALGEASPRP
jgi:hypothetical protein